jgi:acetyl coenzyme A synthetase (ADP forming)-like protein
MKKMRPLFSPAPYQDAPEYGRLILRDGSAATIVLAGPKDQAALLEFFQQLSPESRYRRFFTFCEPNERLMETLCDSSNPQKQLTLLVTRIVAGSPRVIASGTYVYVEDKTAEVAVAVNDAFQGKGLATLLLERLSLLAVRNGLVRFRAVTHADNKRMLEIFRHSGFPMDQQAGEGQINIELAVVPGEESIARSELRDRVFTAASLLPFFKPKAVAVVGASRRPDSFGFLIMEALMTNRFQGPVYPVNPKAEVIFSIRAYPSVKDLPEEVDLAIIAVRRESVLKVVDDCAARGVRALIVISAGFAEIGEEGRELQAALVEKVRVNGMRLVGPNCLGLMNTHPQVHMNASFSSLFPPAGRIAMSSQSGALGLAILGFAKSLHLGLSTFISVGNKADVTGNDLLQYWEGDKETDVILLYLESFGNPRRFARIARRVSRSKPIVAVKSGRTSAGKRAAGSHTAALAASDAAVEALFRQTGVIRAETLEEMFDLSAMLGSQPLPPGRRVAILTNAGGPGILCADACEAGGLEVKELSPLTRSQLSAFLPVAAGLGNPVDMIASATPEHYQRAIKTLLADDGVDVLIVIYIPVIAETEKIVRAICQGVAEARSEGAVHKPVLACLMMEEGVSKPLTMEKESIPSFPFPEAVARVVSKVADYADWRRKPLGRFFDFEDIDVEKARRVCREAYANRGSGWLGVEETRDVLGAFSLPMPAGGLARTADEAVALAREIGFPVAVKLASLKIVHKTEVGGVKLNLTEEKDVRRAYEAIKDRLSQEGRLQEMEGVLIQPMMKGGVEVMIGVTEDLVFGPLIGFGLGGIHVEVLGDIRFRVPPLTDQDAEELVREIRGYRLLEGYRDHPPADIQAIEEVLIRISRLVEEVPEIQELDLNPILTRPPGEGCSIIDARIYVDQKDKKGRQKGPI